VRAADLRTLATALLADLRARLTAFFAVLTADRALFIALLAERDAVRAPACPVLTAASATFVARPIAPPTTSAARTNCEFLRFAAMAPCYLTSGAGHRLEAVALRIIR